MGWGRSVVVPFCCLREWVWDSFWIGTSACLAVSYHKVTRCLLPWGGWIPWSKLVKIFKVSVAHQDTTPAHLRIWYSPDPSLADGDVLLGWKVTCSLNKRDFAGQHGGWMKFDSWWCNSHFGGSFRFAKLSGFKAFEALSWVLIWEHGLCQFQVSPVSQLQLEKLHLLYQYIPLLACQTAVQKKLLFHVFFWVKQWPRRCFEVLMIVLPTPSGLWTQLPSCNFVLRVPSKRQIRPWEGAVVRNSTPKRGEVEETSRWTRRLGGFWKNFLEMFYRWMSLWKWLFG